MRRFKRFVHYLVLIIVCFLLETCIFKRYLTLANIAPNLLVIIVSSIGFMRGSKEGLIVGFICGMLKDITAGDLIGFYAMIYMFIGYGNGLFLRLFYDEDIKLPLVLISASELIYGLQIYIFKFMLGSDFHFLSYLSGIILPELIYTILITLVLYHLILRMNRRLEETEKRSASKFV